MNILERACEELNKDLAFHDGDYVSIDQLKRALRVNVLEIMQTLQDARDAALNRRPLTALEILRSEITGDLLEGR